MVVEVVVVVIVRRTTASLHRRFLVWRRSRRLYLPRRFPHGGSVSWSCPIRDAMHRLGRFHPPVPTKFQPWGSDFRFSHLRL